MVIQCQKLSLSGFKWVEDLSKFNVDFIKSYNEQSSEGYFLEVDVQYPENLHETHNNLPFLPKIKKVDKVNKVVVNCKIKKRIYYTHKKSNRTIKSLISFAKNSKCHEN